MTQAIFEQLEIQEIHDTLLSILRIVVELCEANGIEYFLIGGGCLGMARHDHKMISWDDDLDISIWANDMPRFVQAAQTLPSRYKLTFRTLSKNSSIQISDTSTLIEFDNPSKKQLICADNVFIDVVPMMYWPSLAWKRFDNWYAIALAINRTTNSPTPWKAIVKKLLRFSGLPHLTVSLGRRFYEPLVERMNCRCHAEGVGFISGAMGQKWIGRYPWHVIYPLKNRPLGSFGNTDTVLVSSPNDLHEFVRLRYGNNCMQQPKPETLWKHFDRAVRIKP